VTRAVPDDELDAAVAAVCASSVSGSPQGMRETKALLSRDLLARIDDLVNPSASRHGALAAEPS